MAPHEQLRRVPKVHAPHLDKPPPPGSSNVTESDDENAKRAGARWRSDGPDACAPEAHAPPPEPRHDSRSAGAPTGWSLPRKGQG